MLPNVPPRLPSGFVVVVAAVVAEYRHLAARLRLPKALAQMIARVYGSVSAMSDAN